MEGGRGALKWIDSWKLDEEICTIDVIFYAQGDRLRFSEVGSLHVALQSFTHALGLLPSRQEELSRPPDAQLRPELGGGARPEAAGSRCHHFYIASGEARSKQGGVQVPRSEVLHR